MSIVLSPQDIADITRYRQPKRQLQALADMGIPFHVRHDGSPAVLRSAVENGQPATEPNFSSLQPLD